MYENIALGYRWSLALCLTKVRSSRACCPATALIFLPLKIFILTTKKKVLYIAWACFHNVCLGKAYYLLTLLLLVHYENMPM